MRHRSPTTLMAVGTGIVALFLLICVAAALQGAPRISDVSFDWFQVPTAPPQPSGPESLGVPVEAIPPATGGGAILEAIGWIVAAVLILLLAFALTRIARRIWAGRGLRRRGGAPVDSAGVSTRTPQPANVLRERIAAITEDLARPAGAGEGIVAAWVGLEAAANATGRSRGVAETPAEFAVRAVARDGAVAADVRTLLSLYESVRFAGHAASEEDRRHAMALLGRIRDAWQ